MSSPQLLKSARRAAACALALGLALPFAPARAAESVAAPNLALAPAQTQLAIGLPHVQEVLDRVIALEKRVSPDEQGIAREIDRVLADLARDLGAPAGSNFAEIAEARGLDASKGVAVFADFSAMLEDALEQVKAHEEKVKASESAAATEGAEEGDAGEEAEEEEKFELDTDSLEKPRLAAVLNIADEEKVRAGLQELVDEMDELSGDATESQVGDVTVTAHGEYGYFIQGGRVVLGHLDMVKSAADRVANPAPVRYGSEDFPAHDAQDIVVQVYGKDFLPKLKQALPYLDVDDDVRPLVNMQVASLEAMFGPDDENDPLIAAIGLTDERLSIDIRIDTEKHPGVLAFAGAAEPLRLAQLLPDETLALLSLRFNEETKKQFTEAYLPALAEAMGEENDPQRMAIANQVFDMIGDEVTLGVSGSQEDFPAIYIMIGLSNPDATKGLLSMFVPTLPGETHGDIEIGTVAAPIPVPISIAYPGDMVLLSNNVEGIKKVIDLIGEGKTTNLFATLEMDPKTPRYNSVVLNTRLFTDVVMPLASLAGGIPGDAEPIINQITPVVREIRLFKEIQAPWSVTQLVVSLHPEKAQAPSETDDSAPGSE